MEIIRIVIGAYLIYYGLSGFPWPKRDRHKKFLALSCIFITLGGLLGIILANWIILIMGGVLGFGIIILNIKFARNPKKIARDVTFLYEILRKNYKGFFDSDVDIVYATAMIYLHPYIRVGKLNLADIKLHFSGLIDTYADNLDCPGFFNDFALTMVYIRELMDYLSAYSLQKLDNGNPSKNTLRAVDYATEKREGSLIIVNYITKTAQQSIEENRIDLSIWRSKIENSLASPNLAQLLKNQL
jgi:hypothetical protein